MAINVNNTEADALTFLALSVRDLASSPCGSPSRATSTLTRAAVCHLDFQC
jgi:hypothetical protein